VVACMFACMQVNCDVSVDTKHQTVQGVAFPLSQAAVAELNRLKAGKVNYVQLVCAFFLRVSVIRNSFSLLLNLCHLVFWKLYRCYIGNCSQEQTIAYWSSRHFVWLLSKKNPRSTTSYLERHHLERH